MQLPSEWLHNFQPKRHRCRMDIPKQILSIVFMSHVPEKYVKLVQDMYTGCRTKVRTVAGESSKFNVEVGLHQGSALSPYLFLILMDVLTERVRKEAPESMLFADDIVLCGDKDVDMTEYLESWRKALGREGNAGQ